MAAALSACALLQPLHADGEARHIEVARLVEVREDRRFAADERTNSVMISGTMSGWLMKAYLNVSPR
mgnify:CR=1 FL=1